MATPVHLYKEINGDVSVLTWLKGLKDKNARARCIACVKELISQGYKLSMPLSEPLGDGLHYLRAKSGNVQYRIFYFFHGGAAILLHGCTKEKVARTMDFTIAKNRRREYKLDATGRTFVYEWQKDHDMRA
jgi:putative component of toxin-antitoxin plasmid stabilization module